MEKEELFEKWINSLNVPLLGWQRYILREACLGSHKKIYISMPRSYGRLMVRKLAEQFEQMIKGEKEMQKKLDKFDMKDIHSGYVVKFRDNTYALVMRVGEKFTKVFTKTHRRVETANPKEGVDFFYTSTFNGNVHYAFNPVLNRTEHDSDHDVVAVYGLVEGVKNYLEVGNYCVPYRPLLWEETKKMTLEDIEKALGYKVEIIKEEPPIKCLELCKKCEYSTDRMNCGNKRACKGCKMCLDKEAIDRALNFGTTHCICNTIAMGEPCPYFEEEKA